MPGITEAVNEYQCELSTNQIIVSLVPGSARDLGRLGRAGHLSSLLDGDDGGEGSSEGRRVRAYRYFGGRDDRSLPDPLRISGAATWEICVVQRAEIPEERTSRPASLEIMTDMWDTSIFGSIAAIVSCFLSLVSIGISVVAIRLAGPSLRANTYTDDGYTYFELYNRRRGSIKVYDLGFQAEDMYSYHGYTRWYERELMLEGPSFPYMLKGTEYEYWKTRSEGLIDPVYTQGARLRVRAGATGRTKYFKVKPDSRRNRNRIEGWGMMDSKKDEIHRKRDDQPPAG